MFKRTFQSLSLVTTIIVASSSNLYAAPFPNGNMARKLASDAIDLSRYTTGHIDYDQAYKYLIQVQQQTDSNSPAGEASRKLAPIFRDIALGGAGIISAGCYVIQSPQQKENCVQQIMNWLP